MSEDIENSKAVDATSAIPIIEGFTGPQEQVEFHLSEIPSGSAALVVVKGPQIGDSFALKPEGTLIGRGQEVNLMLDDVTVSRRHAIVEKSGEAWQISDLDSLNGTYVNRNRVNSCTLQGGEELQIGKYRFAFLLPTAENA